MRKKVKIVYDPKEEIEFKISDKSDSLIINLKPGNIGTYCLNTSYFNSGTQIEIHKRFIDTVSISDLTRLTLHEHSAIVFDNKTNIILKLLFARTRSTSFDKDGIGEDGI